MNGDEALALSPPSCSFLWDGSQGRTEDDGGRGCGTWAGPLASSPRIRVAGFNGHGRRRAAPKSKTTPKASSSRLCHRQTRPLPPAGGGE